MSAEEMPIEFDIPTRRKPAEPVVPDEPTDDLSWLSALFEDDESTSDAPADPEVAETDVPHAEALARDTSGLASTPPDHPPEDPTPTATVSAPPPHLPVDGPDGDGIEHPPELPHHEAEPATDTAAVDDPTTPDRMADGAAHGAAGSDAAPKAAVRRGFREALLATFSQLHDD